MKRSPDSTVTLVNDYLEPKLAELNSQRVSDRSRWLLVPALRRLSAGGADLPPGRERLLDLLVRSHDTKPRGQGVLDRAPARAVATSPLARYALGQSGIQLAAIEIAKAIATGLRTDLRDHIVSLDLLGSTIAKHYVAHRPQCPTCGSKKLQNLRRAPVPIELGPGAKLVMTSGDTTVSSRATVERFRKHRQPPHRCGHAARSDRG